MKMRFEALTAVSKLVVLHMTPCNFIAVFTINKIEAPGLAKAFVL